MLKVSITKVPEKGQRVRRAYINADGALTEILDDICCAINGVYVSLRKRNPVMADLYQAALTHAILDPEGPVWDIEMPGNSVAIVTQKKEAAHHD